MSIFIILSHKCHAIVANRFFRCRHHFIVVTIFTIAAGRAGEPSEPSSADSFGRYFARALDGPKAFFEHRVRVRCTREVSTTAMALEAQLLSWGTRGFVCFVLFECIPFLGWRYQCLGLKSCLRVKTFTLGSKPRLTLILHLWSKINRKEATDQI